MGTSVNQKDLSKRQRYFLPGLTFLAIYGLAFAVPLVIVGLFTGPAVLMGAAVHFIIGMLALVFRIRMDKTKAEQK